MFALLAAIILLLHAIGVLDNDDNINWLVFGLAFWALHFAVGWSLSFPLNRNTERS